MTRFSIWCCSTELGQHETYSTPQTPESVADSVSRRLTVPTFLSPHSYYNVGVQQLSGNAHSSNTVSRRRPEFHSFIQASGTREAMTVNIRIPDGKDGYTQYVVAREPISDRASWTSLSWEDHQARIITVPLHPEEILTGEQAVPIFRDYIINNRIPPSSLLRRINAHPTQRPAYDKDAIAQPRSLVSPVTPGVPRYVIWSVGRGLPHREYFMNPQTPDDVAGRISEDLTNPLFLYDGGHFSLGVEQLPEGISFPEDIPKDHPYQPRYLQVGGSHQAMTVEARIPDEAEGYIHYVVAREPVQDPHAWASLTWDNGAEERYTTHLHPEEIFTGEQAAPVFYQFIVNNQLPPSNLLRQIDI